MIKSLYEDLPVTHKVVSRLIASGYAATVDLRMDYDEKQGVDGGTLYRKDSLIQLWWSGVKRKETWTLPTINKALETFRDMADRLNG